jgi:hypothetical protein
LAEEIRHVVPVFTHLSQRKSGKGKRDVVTQKWCVKTLMSNGIDIHINRGITWFLRMVYLQKLCQPGMNRTAMGWNDERAADFCNIVGQKCASGTNQQ